ncbi:ThiF family adenylyltransferase [Paraperlucidibaca sp.]|uniref:ThiF family adenylyltransferase n=1 Tax=Paraperlucidibaca sp. TaxID=2708021 RepID=UPI0030F38388
MPDSLLGSVSEFDSSKAILWRWLNEHIHIKLNLNDAELRSYKERSFVSGWEIEIEDDGKRLRLHVLIDGQYPYSPIRIAYKSEDGYLKWPHIEPQGLLCLPSRPVPLVGVEEAIHRAIVDSLDLLRSCQNQEFIKRELRREFISYWQRSANKSSPPVRSLLNIENRSSRMIAVWRGQEFTLVGETREQLEKWLSNRWGTKIFTIVAGGYGFLDHPPTPSYPDEPATLFDLLNEHCSGVMKVIERLPVSEPLVIILGAEAEGGVGLIGARIGVPKLDGFRKGKVNHPLAVKLALWKMRCKMSRLEILRCDASWVHGRGKNPHLKVLLGAHVLVLGCGSLGSQVASRLAQAGVGSLTLVDPDKLTAANVGRHALGGDSIGELKAKALEQVLRRRFPHIENVLGASCTWQELYERSPATFTEASLIVACLGEWSADGQLDEWHANAQLKVPIVYGWLDERGSAAHALYLTNGRAFLSCVTGPDGRLRYPETLWSGEVLLEAEPACGTLFQPYGAVEVAFAEALVSKLSLEVLAGYTLSPTHRVYACSTAQLLESGGEWSEHHIKHRPPGFDGAFEYERPVVECGVCRTCIAHFKL